MGFWRPPLALKAWLHAALRRNGFSPKGTKCAPPTYVGKVLSSARESSSQHTRTGLGLPGTALTLDGGLKPTVYRVKRPGFPKQQREMWNMDLQDNVLCLPKECHDVGETESEQRDLAQSLLAACQTAVEGFPTTLEEDQAALATAQSAHNEPLV